MNRLSLKQRLARWAAVAACALAESGATAYAASALVHVVVLGGALILAPWASSGVGFSVTQGNGGNGEHASPLGSAGGSETTEVIRFELLKPRPVVSGPLPVEEMPAESEPVIVTDSRPVVSESEEVLVARPLPLNVLPDSGATVRYERPTVKEESRSLEATPEPIQRREKQEETVPDEAQREPTKIARRALPDSPLSGEVAAAVPEVEEPSGRGIAGGGTGGGMGEGNGGGRGLAGGTVDTLPRSGPMNPLPPYPEDAQLAGIEGRVWVQLLVTADGLVKTAKLHTSAGWKSLDDSAVNTLRHWRFEPARRGGVPVECEFKLGFDFVFPRS